MYADNTLTPKEAIRLCALGTLAAGPIRYADLATGIRHFVSRITGPSLELMAESIELLRYEGLATESTAERQDEAMVTITEEGRAALRELLVANLRPGHGDLKELVVALKFRFMHLLDPEEQKSQAEILIETCETDLVRLEDLRRYHEGDPGHLTAWLDHDIERMEARLAWLNVFRGRVAEGPGADAVGSDSTN
jgi:DNA-binding PadR family transcriptional regulator